MTPPHPGEFIRDEILTELGLSVSEAADALGVRRATLSDLINGKAALSPEMALRVEKAFGVDMETLLRMPAWHDVPISCAAAPERSHVIDHSTRKRARLRYRLRAAAFTNPRFASRLHRRRTPNYCQAYRRASQIVLLAFRA
jgi:antitoxin HigA-1